MIVQFDRPVCQKHKLPLSYLCHNLNCNCDVKLCLKCAQSHCGKSDVDDHFFKDSVFEKKLEIETEIIAKQYRHLEKYQSQQKNGSLLNSKNEEGIHYVEMIMRKINEEKKLVFRNVEDFNFSHFDVKKKLNKIKGSHSGNYLSVLASKKIINIVTMLSSEDGVDRLRKKIAQTHNAAQKYQEFINAVKKYGSSSK